jgi:hypothetical protein
LSREITSWLGISITRMRKSDPDHFLHERNHQDEARPFDRLKTPEREDHSTFILAQDLHARGDQNQGHDQDHRHDIQS